MRAGDPSRNYALAIDAVARFIKDHPETEPTACAYLMMRAGMMAIKAERSAGHAAQLAYRLADEFGVENDYRDK